MDLAALRDKAANLAGQTAVLGGQLYSDAELDEDINDAGEWLWMRAKRLNNNWGVEESILNVAADTSDVSLSATFQSRILQVAFGNSGVNFNNNAPAPGNHILLQPAPSNYGAEREHQLGRIQGVEYFKYLFTGGADKIRLIGPPGTTQTGGLQVRQETGWTVLSNVSDVPLFPVEHHRLIAYRAAKLLRGMISLGHEPELEEGYLSRLESFDEGMATMILDLEYKIPTAGLRHQSSATKTGRVRRRSASGTRDIF